MLMIFGAMGLWRNILVVLRGENKYEQKHATWQIILEILLDLPPPRMQSWQMSQFRFEFPIKHVKMPRVVTVTGWGVIQ